MATGDAGSGARGRAVFTAEVALAEVALLCVGDEDIEDCLRLVRNGVPLAHPLFYREQFHPSQLP